MNKQPPALGKRTMAALLTLLLLPMRGTYAGGPLTVGGPTDGIPGVPLVWDNTRSIAYRVDSGPLSRQPAGGPVVITNAQGLIRVQNMFANWSAVPTANLNINNAGGLLAVGTFPANGDVQSVTDFLTVAGDLAGQAPDPNSCNGGGQSPIVFDADGTIFYGLGLPPAGKKPLTSSYGPLSGTVFFSDGFTPAQGVNVIARSTSLPRRNAASAVSGFSFPGNPGQTTTCLNPAAPTPQTCSNLGDPFGSRDPTLIGHFEIPLPPGNYTLQLESIFSGFGGGSSVGPLDPPIPAPGTYSSAATLSVTPGATTAFNITLQGPQQRFDAFESASLLASLPPIWLRRKQWNREVSDT